MQQLPSTSAGKSSQLSPLWLWLLITVSLTWHLYPLLQSRIIAGWDLTGHYQLFTSMLSLLSQGKISGYDPLLFAGYPVFSLYSPFAYIIASVPYFISAQLISAELSFNISVFLIPFALLIALFISTRTIFGIGSAYCALLLGCLTFALPSQFNAVTPNIAGLVRLGFYANYMALPLLLLFFAALDRIRQSHTLLRECAAGILLAVTICTHQLTALFACAVLGVWWIIRPYHRIRSLMIIMLLGFSLSAFFWYPGLADLPFESGQKLGGAPRTSDVLVNLLPELNYQRIVQVTDALFSARAGLPLLDYLYVCLKGLLYAFKLFPILGLLLLIGTVYGIRQLIRQQRADFAIIFLTLLIILPRDLLGEISDLTVHYYRFTQMLFLLELLIASYGLTQLALLIQHRLPSLSSRRQLLILALVALPILAFKFDLADRSESDLKSRPAFFPFVDQYPDYKDATALCEYLASKKPLGRVIEEKTYQNYLTLGSYHYFSSILPAQYNIEVINGLLLESSMTAGFINQVLRYGSEYFGFGRTMLLGNRRFYSQDIDSMVKRMHLYGVEYILATSSRYTEKLSHSTLLSLDQSFGRFRLFKIALPIARIQESTYQPFLFVPEGGVSFREFAEHWFLEPKLYATPVIYAPHGVAELSPFERSQLGGYILSWPKDYPLDRSMIDSWIAHGKPLIVISTGTFAPADFKKLPPTVTLISRLGSFDSYQQLLQLLRPKDSREVQWRAHADQSLLKESIVLDSARSVLLNYSYASHWKLKQQERRNRGTVFAATPSIMFFFGNGINKLSYE